MARRKKTIIRESFYTKGYAVLRHVKSIEDAQEVVKQFIATLDKETIPLYQRFTKRIQMLKLNAMPIADDVDNAFQGLHFDMGHPFISGKQQAMYMITGLYLPPNADISEGKTRVVKIAGLLADKRWGSKQKIEKKIISYTKKYGDGWSMQQKNTGRLCCFAKVIDALGKTRKLPDYIDWFYDYTVDGEGNRKKELKFYQEHDIDIAKREEHVLLLPGEILIIDNTRTIHSRFGKRKEKEMWQFLYGVKDARAGDMPFLRKQIIKELTDNTKYAN